eukprot:CAMPEP_0176478190 /NCGR_PEP_ID=MMETSP0200_2-20121128/1049_1 /TAXON_ID=947934 /ORGANISM="Chaetoceros sp., Strain GSL56" /LENGTH=1036 /DNA_ID=CAMNT_0017874101 /DNA_START=97 /DNA_END=3207 /DNA_ORIENTATION=+
MRMGNIHYGKNKKKSSQQSSRSKNNTSVPKPVLQSTPQQEEAAAKHVGGEISANLIAAIFMPQITEIVERQAEIYAQEILHQQQQLIQMQMEQEGQQNEVKEDADEKEEEEEGGEVITERQEDHSHEEEDEEEGDQGGSHDYAANRKNAFESTTHLASLDQLNLPPFLYATSESREEINTILQDVSNHFTSLEKKSTAPWKIHANAAKFERQLDEKYGILRPFITQHPEIEIFLRGVQRKYSRGEFSPFRQGNAPVDKKTSIIILFIMYRNGVKLEKLILAATFFLVGLQPWALVLLVIFGRQLMEGRRKKKVGGWLGREVKTVKAYYADAESEKAKHDILRKSVGNPISEDDFAEEKEGGYDTMVVGSGVDTLYTAALLARTGRTVLVLSPENDASGCYNIAESNGMSDAIQTIYGNVPFDVHGNHVAHVERQQRLLAPALCTDTDAQGGIRFCRIGTEGDGFTSDILSIPGMGVDSRKDTHPFLLRAGGVSNIAVDAATYLGDGWPEDDGVGHSTSAGYLAAVAGINATASEFYMSKLLNESVSGMKKNSSYQEASVRYASAFLDQLLPLNPHVRSLMAGIGMKGENLPPSKTSMAVHVTNTCAQISPEGFSYPVGGPRAISHALASVVEQNGGKVITEVKIKEFLYHEKDDLHNNQKEEAKSNKTDGRVDHSKPRCHGVKLLDGRLISVGKNDESYVVSMLGFIPTFIFYMPDEIRTKYGVPSGLHALTERRPLLHFIVALDGTAEELNLTAADWYRLPNASLALDEMDPITGQVTQGLIGAQVIDFDEHDDSTASGSEVQPEDETEAIAKRDKRAKSGTVPTRKKTKRNKFTTGQSWMKVSFPSAKDPSWKERHGKISTCVVTIEADDNFVQLFDSSPKIFSATKFTQEACAHVVEGVKKDLIDNYPQLQDKIDFISMVGPVRKGLSHTPLRYAVKGIRPETPYPGLIVGGSDLTVGDSFSGAIVAGWMAANAVIKYSAIDHLYLDKNITNDLKLFLSSPRSKVNGDDIAVPFKMTDSEKDSPQAAESSKEE